MIGHVTFEPIDINNPGNISTQSGEIGMRRNKEKEIDTINFSSKVSVTLYDNRRGIYIESDYLGTVFDKYA